MKKKNNPSHNLFIKVIDKKKPIRYDSLGNKWIAIKWIGVESINLGSIKKPNKKVLEIKIKPIIIEQKNIDTDFFKGLFK